MRACSRQTSGLGVVLLVALLAIAPYAASSDERRPNIVIVMLDDLGYADLGFMGSEIETPNIDALAGNGLTMTQFYVHPRCSPTRAALLTGKFPHDVGMGFLTTPPGIDVEPGPFQGYLDHDVVTLPEALGEAGYRTYMSGKWHLGEAPRNWPRQHGFDRYFGLISGANSYYEMRPDEPLPRAMAEDDERFTPPADGFYMTDAFTDKALDYLRDHEREHADRPFFMYLAYTAPHWPLHAPEPQVQKYLSLYQAGPHQTAARRAARQQQLGMPGLPPEGAGDKWVDTDDWARRMAVYAAMVSIADAGIGQVVDELHRTGSLENTLILVFSDNGACAELVARRGLHKPGAITGMPGSYRAYGPDWAATSNTPLRDVKGTTFEGGIRSALISHWPAGIAAEGRLDQTSVASVMDLMPTLLSVAGADTAGRSAVGNDISVLFDGDQLTSSRPLIWEHVGWRGIREGNLKAVFDPAAGAWSLFDLAEDPAERDDLAASRPQDLERLRAQVEQWIAARDLQDADPLRYYRELLQGK